MDYTVLCYSFLQFIINVVDLVLSRGFLWIGGSIILVTVHISLLTFIRAFRPLPCVVMIGCLLMLTRDEYNCRSPLLPYSGSIGLEMHCSFVSSSTKFW